MTGDETVAAAAIPSLPPIIAGRYVLEAMIGGGGMGKVYRALDREAARQDDPDPYVALKLLSESLPDQSLAAKALQRECKRAQKLFHENIVRVSYFGRDGDKYYLTMELLKGRSFLQLLEENKQGLPPAQVFDLTRQMLAALACAHRHDIIHSDVKPSNLFLTNEGVVKVLDFGIAAPRIPEGAADKGTFNPRASLGALSLKHAPLEQWLGIPADPSDDVYSAACVIYELLTGKHPFNGEPAPNAYQKNMVPAEIASIAPHQNEALRHALAFTRQKRTTTIEELKSQLFDPPQRESGGAEAHADPGATPANPPAEPRPRTRPASRNAVLVASVVILAAAGGGTWFALDRKPSTDTQLSSASPPPAVEPPPTSTDVTPASGRDEVAPPRPEEAGTAVVRTSVDTANGSAQTTTDSEFPATLFSNARVCPDLENSWATMSCEDRKRCISSRASDAGAAGGLASDDVKPIFEARQRMYQELGKTSCNDLDASRTRVFRDFHARFPNVPIS